MENEKLKKMISAVFTYKNVAIYSEIVDKWVDVLGRFPTEDIIRGLIACIKHPGLEIQAVIDECVPSVRKIAEEAWTMLAENFREGAGDAGLSKEILEVVRACGGLAFKAELSIEERKKYFVAQYVDIFPDGKQDEFYQQVITR